MTNFEDLLIYAVVVLLSFVVRFVYGWLTAKNDQFSYPAKLRKVVKKLPWVATSSFPVLIVDYLTDATPTIALGFFLLGVAMVALGLLAIIAALFHRQSRDRVSWLTAFFTVVATAIAFVVTAIIGILKAIDWVEALGSQERSHDGPNDAHEDASRLGNEFGSVGYHDPYTGKYRRGSDGPWD